MDAWPRCTHGFIAACGEGCMPSEWPPARRVQSPPDEGATMEKITTLDEIATFLRATEREITIACTAGRWTVKVFTKTGKLLGIGDGPEMRIALEVAIGEALR